MRFLEVIEDVARARRELRRRNLPAEPRPRLEREHPTGTIDRLIPSSTS
jgi:hypothetical protein